MRFPVCSLLSLLASLSFISQLLSSVDSAALPNALPARHPPETRTVVATVAGAGSTPTGTGSLALLRIGPVPAVHSTVPTGTGGHALPSVAASGPVARGPHPALDHAATSSTTDDSAVAAKLGADACAANGDCARLGEAVVSAVEGSECRALHVTGKCPAKCLSALNSAIGNKLWTACAARCETDVVAGAAQRWVKLCEARQVTLLDQGKEAVKSLVVAGPAAGRALQAIGILAILIGAVMVGYRRGLLQGHALRLQKRMKKRGSERSFV